jgi:voltage-dependent calcium channel T type alpha-1G
MREPPYWANYSGPRLVMHNICASKYFDLAIAGVIGLNVITMALEFYMMPPVSKVYTIMFTPARDFLLETPWRIIIPNPNVNMAL